MVKNKISRIILALSFTTGICLAIDSEYARERYEVIVDRSPFGADPLAGDAVVSLAKDAANAVAASRAAEKELRLCFLLESQTGEVRAGFENKTAKLGDPKSIMLMAGESFRGIKLLEINLINSSATLNYNGNKVIFKLAESAGVAPSKKEPDSSVRRFGDGGSRQSFEIPEDPAFDSSMLEEERLAKELVARDELRQCQMDTIRAGMPPLPIPLTQDMDDQLVTEGFLPPSK